MVALLKIFLDLQGNHKGLPLHLSINLSRTQPKNENLMKTEDKIRNQLATNPIIIYMKGIPS